MSVVSIGTCVLLPEQTAGPFPLDEFEDGGDGKDEGSGTTFLRGTQTAGDDGIAGDPATEGTLIALSPAETTAGAGTLGLLDLGVDA